MSCSVGMGRMAARLATLLLAVTLTNAALPAPGVRILEYLHARGESTWITLPQPVKGAYVFTRDTGSVDQAVMTAVRQGFNLIVLSFLTSSGLVGAALSWQGLNSTRRAAALDFAHWNGAVLLLSAGGAEDHPYGMDPVLYGQQAASWAYELGLDGVDFDLENVNVGFTYPKANVTSTGLVDWFIRASVAARGVLGSGKCGGIIAHAPQAPYFGPIGGVGYWAGRTGGFTAVYEALAAAVPPAIDVIFAQYYNQGPSCYFSYESVFLEATADGCWAPSTSIAELAAFGVPASLVALTKPMIPGDNPDGSGLSSPYDIAGWVTRARLAGTWGTGVVIWQFSAEHGGTWLNTVYPPSVPLNVTAVGEAMTAVLTCDVVRPPSSQSASPSAKPFNATMAAAAAAASQSSSTNWAAIGGALGGVGGFILLCICLSVCCCTGQKDDAKPPPPPPEAAPADADKQQQQQPQAPPVVAAALAGRRGSAGSVPSHRGSGADSGDPTAGGAEAEEARRASAVRAAAYPYRSSGGALGLTARRRSSGGGIPLPAPGARPPPPAVEDADFDAVPIVPGLALSHLEAAAMPHGAGRPPRRRSSGGGSRVSDSRGGGGRRASPLSSPPLAAAAYYIDGQEDPMRGGSPGGAVRRTSAERGVASSAGSPPGRCYVPAPVSQAMPPLPWEQQQQQRQYPPQQPQQQPYPPARLSGGGGGEPPYPQPSGAPYYGEPQAAPGYGPPGQQYWQPQQQQPGAPPRELAGYGAPPQGRQAPPPLAGSPEVPRRRSALGYAPPVLMTGGGPPQQGGR